jgi:hypothetical protein
MAGAGDFENADRREGLMREIPNTRKVNLSFHPTSGYIRFGTEDVAVDSERQRRGEISMRQSSLSPIRHWANGAATFSTD